MKKDGLFAQVMQALVAEERKRVVEKPPDIVFNQKKQLWYLMMNQIDGAPDAQEKPGADDDQNAETQNHQ